MYSPFTEVVVCLSKARVAFEKESPDNARDTLLGISPVLLSNETIISAWDELFEKVTFPVIVPVVSGSLIDKSHPERITIQAITIAINV
jgi:hypothetical protein